MSKKEPDCPMYNHDQCKYIYAPKICALARDDRKCLKEQPKKKVKHE